MIYTCPMHPQIEQDHPGNCPMISTRAFAQSGSNVLIGGFTISGSGTKTVLVRALGPTLSSFGLAIQ